MNPYLLLLALRGFLDEHLKDYPMQSHTRGRAEKDFDAETSLRPPTVIIGALPENGRERLESVPFVAIQTMEGKNIDGEEYVTIAFRIAIKNTDTEAREHDLHNLITTVRNRLYQISKEPLLNKIQLLEYEKKMLPWTRPDAQEEPYGQAFILSTFKFAGMQ